MTTSKTIIRLSRRPRNFLLVDKGYLADPQLGLTAMGLLTWMLARPDDWKMHQGQIARATGESLYAVRQAMRRLDECGYVRRSPVRDARTGRIIRWELVVFETRQLAEYAEAAEPGLFERVENRPRRARSAAVETGQPQGSEGQKPRFQRNSPEVESPGGGPPASGFPSSGKPSNGFRTLLSNEGTEGNAVTEERRQKGAGESGPSESAAATGIPVAAEPPALSAGVVVALRSFGFSQRDAERLLRRFGRESAERALAVLGSTRTPVGNPRGFLVGAMREGWTPATTPATPEIRARRALERFKQTRQIEQEASRDG